MLIDIKELLIIPEFANIPLPQLKRQMAAVENTIREHTKNNFQNRAIRFEAETEGNTVKGTHQFLRKGDTIQISESVNNGLYVIEDMTNGVIKVDGELHSTEHNLITKVEYPADIIDGAIELLKWRVNFGGKLGIKSESISRHSVTYYDNASQNANGYPVALMAFLQPYMKARF